MSVNRNIVLARRKMTYKIEGGMLYITRDEATEIYTLKEYNGILRFKKKMGELRNSKFEYLTNKYK